MANLAAARDACRKELQELLEAPGDIQYYRVTSG